MQKFQVCHLYTFNTVTIYVYGHIKIPVITATIWYIPKVLEQMTRLDAEIFFVQTRLDVYFSGHRRTHTDAHGHT